MSHDIEASYVDDYHNEEKRCPNCDSYQNGFCTELEQHVPITAHCDFFRSID